MPTIVVASPKGGSGKSTSANLLATALASRGATVTMIDADPNRPQVKWARLPNKPEKLTVIQQSSEHSIIDTIEAAAKQATFVIADLEGTASQMASFAIGRADLAIIPCQGSPLDAVEAVAAVRLVADCGKLTGKPIPYGVLITRTNPAILPRTVRAIIERFRENNVRLFKTHVNERDAFRAVFDYGGTVRDLTDGQAGGLQGAIKNVNEFTIEIVDVLKQSVGQQKAVA